MLGLESSAIGTLVERTTRFTMLSHLPRLEGHGPPAPTRTDRRWSVTAGRPSVTNSPERSPLIEPVDPAEGGQLEVVDATPGAFTADAFGLVQADGALSELSPDPFAGGLGEAVPRPSQDTWRQSLRR